MNNALDYGDVLLTIDHVSLSYENKVVLRDVNAEIRKIIGGSEKGQIVGFLGPSGIGKTTLFRIISGLEQPTSGFVKIMAEANPVQAGEVGVLAQNYPMFNHRTVMSNLMLAASKKEKNSKAAKEKCLEFLNEFDLLDKANLYPAELSGGQKQRCAIIQQILCSHNFLLMDEPFSGLDMISIERVGQLIQKIAGLDELNTIIICTHDVSSACSVSDHLWLMGRDRNPDGSQIPGARIVKSYDLIERGICWHPEVLTESKFVELVTEIKSDFRKL